MNDYDEVDLNTIFDKGCIRYGDYKEYKMCVYLRSLSTCIDLDGWNHFMDLNTYKDKANDDT